MRGKINALTERGVGMAIIAGVLDEKSWDAISVGGGEGHLENAAIYLPDTNDWFFEKHGEFPVALPLGTEVEGMVDGYNDSPVTARLKGTLELIDPDGIAKGTKSYTGEVAAGDCMYLGTEDVTLSKNGVWKIHGKLETA